MSGLSDPPAAWPHTGLLIEAPDVTIGAFGGGSSMIRWTGLGGASLCVCAWRHCRLSDRCIRWLEDGVIRLADWQRPKHDDAVMARLRSIVGQSELGYQLFCMDDDAVIDQVTRLLQSNRFPLCAQFSHAQRATPAQTKTPSRPEPPPPPTRKSPAPAPVMAATPEASTLSTRHDPIAQAATFATRHDPIAQAVTFATRHDPIAQAATLVQAAQEGVPFCEECARAAAGAAT